MDESLIISRPDLLGGKPCIRGTRLSVEFILELFASGAKREDILGEYPQLTEEALTAALRHAARSVALEVAVPVPGKA